MEADYEASPDVLREPSATGDLVGIEYLPRLLSGVQPSSLIHIGHYFGALRQHINLQHEYPGQMFICIADYHSLTRTTDLPELRAETIELATVYLALGLDVQKCVLY